jgi:hypothetical protein
MRPCQNTWSKPMHICQQHIYIVTPREHQTHTI